MKERENCPAWEVRDVGDGVTRVELNWSPSERLGTEGKGWLQAHGIDPRSVPVPGWVEIDRPRRQVRYSHWIRDLKGVHLLADIDGKTVSYGDERNHQMPDEQRPATRVGVVQLESAPAPWPEPAPPWACRWVGL